MLNKTVTNKKVRPFLVLLVMAAFLFTNAYAYQQAPSDNISKNDVSEGTIETSESPTYSEPKLFLKRKRFWMLRFQGR